MIRYEKVVPLKINLFIIIFTFVLVIEKLILPIFYVH